MFKIIDETDYNITLLDEDGWLLAIVKFDGCVDLYKYYNVPYDEGGKDCNYIHICDIDEFIEELKEINKTALKKFGEFV